MYVANEKKRTLFKSAGIGVLLALLMAIGWGCACGILRLNYAVVVAGGIGLAALGFWLERATLASADTMARKDFYLILVAGFGFFAVIGVGMVSLSALVATWYLPRL